VRAHDAYASPKFRNGDRENGSMALELAGAMFNNVDAGVPDEQ